jgi:hypothetical protein
MADKEEMGWNSEVDADANRPERTLLPEGPVKFVVLAFKRARKEYGKFGTINVAEVTLGVVTLSGDEPPAEVIVNLGLHADLQWKITEFFTAIGQRAHGDKGKFVPRWDQVDGAAGYAINKHRELTSKKSNEKYKVNDLAKFITEAEAKEEAAKPNLNF